MRPDMTFDEFVYWLGTRNCAMSIMRHMYEARWDKAQCWEYLKEIGPVWTDEGWEKYPARPKRKKLGRPRMQITLERAQLRLCQAISKECSLLMGRPSTGPARRFIIEQMEAAQRAAERLYQADAED